MRCAIMQPTYLPWSGYFNLAAQVDYFIILDDVQFNKRSWQQRNRILQNGQELILSVPVFTKNKRDQLIKDVEINNESNWQQTHLKSIEMSYRKSKYKNELMPLIENIYSNKATLLADFNVNFIMKILNLLEIDVKVIKSSEIPVYGKKSEYLIELCKHLNCTDYLSPPGSKDYIEEERNFENSIVALNYQSYVPKPYEQLNTENFISHLSIIDMIFNIGIMETKKRILEN